MKDWNHDLVHQLSEDLDSIWRYKVYLKNSRGCKSCTSMWKQFEKMDQEKAWMLKAEIERHVAEKRFE